MDERLVPEVWIMPPPWPGNGQCLREMLNQEGQWKVTREQVRGIGYWPWLLDQQFNDREIQDFFTKLKVWRLGLGFEVEALKVGVDAKMAFAKNQRFAARFKSLGLDRVDWFGFDEPIYAARDMISITNVPAIPPVKLELVGAVKKDAEVARRLAYGVSETVSFMALMRPAYPGTRLGLIEPYPALNRDELETAVNGIQSECARRGIKGLEFLRIDVDWNRIESNQGRNEKASWAGVRQLEEMCRAKGIAFSLIFWAADWPRLERAGLATPRSWGDGVLHHARKYREVNGSPDELVIESWLPTPDHGVPETTPGTFMASVLDFIRSYPPKSWITNSNHPKPLDFHPRSGSERQRKTQSSLLQKT